MADLAVQLLRMIVRAFYHTEHVLVIDALCFHSTLSDYDLGNVVGMNVKPVRKVVGRLKEDGLISVQTRMERRTDGSGYFGSHGQAGKERLTHRDWYYINFHRAIDAIKYRLWKLSKHVESMGAPTTEKKDLHCPRCKSQYTELEVMDSIDPSSGQFLCHRCGHELDRIEEDERGSENEHMKRLNSQLEPFLSLMRRIDSTTVPENDFDTALSKHIPAKRDDDLNPAPRTEIVDAPNRNLESTKGLEMKPEKIAVQLQDDDTVKKETEAEEARRRREKEARQNALPEWISKSTVTGDITTVGAKEEKLRKEREAHIGAPIKEDEREDKKAVNADDENLMNEYFAELEKQRAKEAAEEEDDDEEEEDDEDDFEDVDVTGANTPAVNGTATNAPASTGFSTPAMESSNATDDERDAKRARLETAVKTEPKSAEIVMSGANGAAPIKQETTEQSDEDGDDDDDLEFENV